MEDADGISFAINANTYAGGKEAVLYGTEQNMAWGADPTNMTTYQKLSFERAVMSSNGSLSGQTTVYLTGAGMQPNFVAPFVLNEQNPSQIAVGGLGVYVFQDDFESNTFAL